MAYKSEDTALFQRDWDSCSGSIQLMLLVGRHCPVPKGLRHSLSTICGMLINKSEDTALFQRDWDFCFAFLVNIFYGSEDTALFQRDWDCQGRATRKAIDVGRHCPVPKGLRQDEPNAPKVDIIVGRHCPVPKGLRRKIYSIVAKSAKSKDTALF